MKTKRVVYNGPPSQVNYEVGAAIDGPAELEPGREYELPEELAEKVKASSPWWADAKPPKKAKED
jgi:hypothetical protein